MPRIKQQALKTELANRGFESISIKRELPGATPRANWCDHHRQAGALSDAHSEA
jgi:hypothetical protein